MERIALAGPGHGGVDEAQVEMGVVADRIALAAVLLHRRAYRGEDGPVRPSSLASRNGWSRMMPVTSQRLRVDLQALGRHHMGTGGLAGVEQAVLVHLDRHRGDFQQGVALAVEAAGFHVHHHRQKPRNRCDIARCAWGLRNRRRRQVREWDRA
jgi:hypothetical protein